LFQNLLNRATGSADPPCYTASLSQCIQTIIGYPASTTPVIAPNNEFQNTWSYGTAPDHSNALYLRQGVPAVPGRGGYPTRIQILGPRNSGARLHRQSGISGLFAN